MLTALLTAACHQEPPPAPPKYAVFGPTETFFDTKFLAPGHAIVTTLGGRFLRVAGFDGASQTGGAKVEKLAEIAPPEGAKVNPQVGRVKFVDDHQGWGVGQGGGIFHTADGGKTWERQESGTTSFLFDVDFVDANHGWVSGERSTLLRTSDGGKTWQPLTVEMSKIGIPPSMGLALESPTFYSVEFLDEMTGWVAGEYGQIDVTHDGGNTWQPQHGSLLGGERRDLMLLPTFQCIRFLDANNGVATGTAQGKGTLGGIAWTSDGGQQWHFADAPTDLPYYDIAWTPDGNSLLVGASGSVLIGNGATGWKEQSLPPGTYASLASIAFDSAGHGLILGAHGTMLASQDFGKQWARVSTQ